MAGSAFGALLRRHRLAAGFTQERLAEHARMSVVGVSALERGSRKAPYRSTVLLLAQALKLTADATDELQAAATRISRPRADPLDTSNRQPTRPGSIPVPITSLFGRDDEIAAIVTLLESQRLITIVGTGGVGKTRLAIAVGLVCSDRFPDGAFFADLAPLVDPALVLATIAAAFGVYEQPNGALIDVLAAALQPRKLLLVLDNCEHIVDEAAAAADRLVRACPRLSIVATSREPLRVSGEWVSQLTPLPIPPAAGARLPRIDETSKSPAARLFLERAAAIGGWTAISDTDAYAVATIVRRLDGLPLAIELAAARTRSFSPHQIATALDTRFALLTNGSRTALPRQQTLRATLDWSFDLLTERERAVFCRCASFAGGWSLESAQQVCCDDTIDAWAVADAVATLIDKSLFVRSRDNAAGTPRFSMLETTRGYAREHLAERGEFPIVARRHAEYYCELAKEANANANDVETSVWLGSIASELANFRSALAWALEDTNDIDLGAELAGALGLYFARLSLAVEGVSWCETALSRLGPEPSSAREASLRLALARLYGFTSGPQGKLAMAQRAVSLYRQLADEPQLAWACIELGHGLYLLGRREEAEQTMIDALSLCRKLGNRRSLGLALRLKSCTIDPENSASRRALLAEALDVYRALGDVPGVASTLVDFAELEFAVGDVAAALAYAHEALESSGTAIDMAQTLVNMAAYALTFGDHAEAEAAACEAIAIAHRSGDLQMVAWALQHLASVLALRGDVQRAARLLGAADAQIAGLGLTRTFTEQSTYQTAERALHAALNQEQFAKLRDDGKTWTIDRAIDEALNATSVGDAGWTDRRAADEPGL